MKYYKREVENGYILLSYKTQPHITSDEIKEITKEEYDALYAELEIRAEQELSKEAEADNAEINMD